MAAPVGKALAAEGGNGIFSQVPGTQKLDSRTCWPTKTYGDTASVLMLKSSTRAKPSPIDPALELV